MVGGHRPTAVEAHGPSATHAPSWIVHPESGIRPGRPAAEQQAAERSAELGGHGVVQDRIDGAVGVDHQATEQHQPDVLVWDGGERIVDDVGAVRQPQHGKHTHDHCQHLCHLHTIRYDTIR